MSLTGTQSAALLAAIKDYESQKWKVIGQKVGKPAKVSTYVPIHRLALRIVTARRLANSMLKSTLGARCKLLPMSIFYYCFLV
jgi:hypothetical protein